MAQILAFDRAARAAADLTTDQVVSRCRTIARARGCNGVNKAVVVAASQKKLAAGVDKYRVIQEARSLAIRLAKPTEQVPA
jgi:hypothetical protein